MGYVGQKEHVRIELRSSATTRSSQSRMQRDNRLLYSFKTFVSIETESLGVRQFDEVSAHVSEHVYMHKTSGYII